MRKSIISAAIVAVILIFLAVLMIFTIKVSAADVNYSICGDVDGNGKVNIRDVTAIQMWLANKKTNYPIGKSIDLEGEDNASIEANELASKEFNFWS